MATVSITYFRPAIIKETAAIVGVSDSVSEVFTSSGTSQATTATATGNRNYVRVVATGGNVYLAFGTSPTAVTATGYLLIADKPEVFYLENGHKVALID